MISKAMRFSSAIAATLLAATGIVSATDHYVQVAPAGSGNIYVPDNVWATAGDRVIFQFTVGNHTVTQSTFEWPCTKAEGGLASGFRPDGTDREFIVDIHDDKPLWFYCGQGNHCETGMVFAVNPGDKLYEFQQIAKGEIPSPWDGGDHHVEHGWWPEYPEPKVHYVQVGRNETGGLAFVFTPPFVHAAIGDVVKFSFNPKNHSATQSSFHDPCTPLDYGLDSGFKPVSIEEFNPDMPPTFEVPVVDYEPKWFHCKQPNGNHCATGMVFAINPDNESEFSFDKFRQKAMATAPVAPAQWRRL